MGGSFHDMNCLLACPHCEGAISRFTHACPSCGAATRHGRQLAGDDQRNVFASQSVFMTVIDVLFRRAGPRRSAATRITDIVAES